MSSFSKFLLSNAGESWSPIKIPSLYSWYDVTDNDLVIHSGGLTEGIIDKSGNARNLAQSTSNLRPHHFDNGGANNLPYIRISGVRNIGITGLNLPQPYSIYVVYKQNSFLQFGMVYQLGDNYTNGLANFQWDGFRNAQTMVSNVAWRPIKNNYFKLNQWLSCGANFTNKVVEWQQQNTSFISFNSSRFRWYETPGGASIDRIYMGGLQFSARCDIHEMIIFSEELSLENEILVKKYIADKYSLPYQKQAYFMGDSITAGYNASDVYHNYVDLVSESIGAFSHNNGLSGTTVLSTGSGNSLEETYNLYTGGDPNDYVMFAYGTNDTYSTAWVNGYKAIIQDFITQGKSLDKIVIITPPWQPANVTKYASMIPALQTMASQLGVKFANAYQSTLDGGGSSLLSDGTHPNDAGMQVIANTIIATINS